ncbi:ladderlectin [Boleophthalmus pectinirostris]|uniref:ladderlectin n=1 Tax=Boleophthalmus pectinirostris TaxID=150288 RepID=UPI0024311AA2|nr:ladderlectin [Boleophthalmus pectinirostris]
MKHVLVLAALFALGEAAPKEVGSHVGGVCRWLVNNITDPNLGQYLPQCDENGNFERRQCWASLGVCWCVNPITGEEVPGSKKMHGQDPPKCDGQEEEEEEEHLEKKPDCPEHWSQFDDHCYIYIDSPKTWAEAEMYCQFEEGHLASVHCSKTKHFLQVLTKGNTHQFPESWVGGTNAVTACLWMWTDGSQFDFEDWSSEECKLREHSCLKINYGYQMHWGSADCNDTLPFVCAKKTEFHHNNHY